MITPDVAMTSTTNQNNNNDITDYEDDLADADVYDDDDDDDDEGLSSSRIVFNFYLDENNKAPIELTQFTASDFDMLASSQEGLKFEILLPASLSTKVCYIYYYYY